MCVCLYICMYVCMCEYMHACMYVRLHACNTIRMYICSQSVSMYHFLFGRQVQRLNDMSMIKNLKSIHRRATLLSVMLM